MTRSGHSRSRDLKNRRDSVESVKEMIKELKRGRRKLRSEITLVIGKLKESKKLKEEAEAQLSSAMRYYDDDVEDSQTEGNTSENFVFIGGNIMDFLTEDIVSSINCHLQVLLPISELSGETSIHTNNSAMSLESLQSNEETMFDSYDYELRSSEKESPRSSAENFDPSIMEYSDSSENEMEESNDESEEEENEFSDMDDQSDDSDNELSDENDEFQDVDRRRLSLTDNSFVSNPQDNTISKIITNSTEEISDPDKREQELSSEKANLASCVEKECVFVQHQKEMDEKSIEMIAENALEKNNKHTQNVVPSELNCYRNHFEEIISSGDSCTVPSKNSSEKICTTVSGKTAEFGDKFVLNFYSDACSTTKHSDDLKLKDVINAMTEKNVNNFEEKLDFESENKGLDENGMNYVSDPCCSTDCYWDIGTTENVLKRSGMDEINDLFNHISQKIENSVFDSLSVNTSSSMPTNEVVSTKVTEHAGGLDEEN